MATCKEWMKKIYLEKFWNGVPEEEEEEEEGEEKEHFKIREGRK